MFCIRILFPIVLLLQPNGTKGLILRRLIRILILMPILILMLMLLRMIFILILRGSGCAAGIFLGHFDTEP